MRLLAIATWAVLFTSPAFAQVHVDNWEHGQGEPSYYRSLVHHSPELHILGAYEGTSNSSIVGVITVHVQTGNGPSVLLCSSYESVLWQFTIDPGANVQRIILNGNEPQQIAGAGIIAVTNLSPSTNWLGTTGYAYPPGPGQSNTNLLISQAEAYTGLTLESFGGAYQPHAFSVPEPAVSAGACVVLAMRWRRNRSRYRRPKF